MHTVVAVTPSWQTWQAYHIPKTTRTFVDVVLVYKSVVFTFVQVVSHHLTMCKHNTIATITIFGRIAKLALSHIHNAKYEIYKNNTQYKTNQRNILRQKQQELVNWVCRCVAHSSLKLSLDTYLVIYIFEHRLEASVKRIHSKILSLKKSPQIQTRQKICSRNRIIKTIAEYSYFQNRSLSKNTREADAMLRDVCKT